LSIEVIVITNGSDLGEEILRRTWYAAQKLFHEYGIKAYVIPYQVRHGRVSLVINGLEYPVSKLPRPEELIDLILSAASNEEMWTKGEVVGATIIEEGEFGDGAVVNI